MRDMRFKFGDTGQLALQASSQAGGKRMEPQIVPLKRTVVYTEPFLRFQTNSFGGPYNIPLQSM